MHLPLAIARSGDHFAGRRDENGIHLLDGALGCGVKSANGFDFVAEEIETIRKLIGGRPNVHNPAASRELSLLQNSINTLVSGSIPAAQHGIGLNRLPCSQLLTSLEEVTAREGTRHESPHR